MVTNVLVIGGDESKRAIAQIKRPSLEKNTENKNGDNSGIYLSHAKSTLSILNGNVKKGKTGLYIFDNSEEKEYIYINAMLGVLYSMSGDKNSSEDILKKIRTAKDKDGNYPLITSEKKKSNLSNLFVSMLEYMVGDQNESERLGLLKEAKRGPKGLYCSDIDGSIEHTYLNAIKGIVEGQKGSISGAKLFLEKIEKNIPKNKRGLFGSSSINSSELPDVSIAIALLKYYANGIYDSEEYLQRLQRAHYRDSKSVSSVLLEGILYYALSGRTLNQH